MISPVEKMILEALKPLEYSISFGGVASAVKLPRHVINKHLKAMNKKGLVTIYPFRKGEPLLPYNGGVLITSKGRDALEEAF